MMRFKLSFILLLAIAYSSLAGENSNGVRALVSEEGRLNAAALTNNDWRLFSLIYPALPDTGYSIEFRSNNVVETDNLDGVKMWSLATDGSLLLLGENTVVLYRFRFDSCQNALATVVRSPLAPSGIGFALRLASQPSLSQACKERSSSAPFCCLSVTEQSEGASNSVPLCVSECVDQQ